MGVVVPRGEGSSCEMLVLERRKVFSLGSKRVDDVSELHSPEQGESCPTNVEVAGGRIRSRPSREMRFGGGFPGHGGRGKSVRESSMVVGDVGVDGREGFARMGKGSRGGKGVDLTEGNGWLLR